MEHQDVTDSLSIKEHLAVIEELMKKHRENTPNNDVRPLREACYRAKFLADASNSLHEHLKKLLTMYDERQRSDR